MTNGAMNVEIGNPAYKIYEGEPDDDAGELLDAVFTLDPDKVDTRTRHTNVFTQRFSSKFGLIYDFDNDKNPIN